MSAGTDVGAPNPPRMTHQRYGVVGMLFFMAVITFMDRICISTASDLVMVRILGEKGPS